MMMKYLCLIFLLIYSICSVAQQLHAHNDYEKPEVFTNAYRHGAGSIEADIFLQNGELLVAHDVSQFDRARTITSLYLDPIDSIIKVGTARTFQLMIDLKTEAHATLKELNNVLQRYPEITGSDKISIVISGNRPAPKEFINYPAYILFDGLLNVKYSSSELKRVPVFSDNFKNYRDTLQLKEAIAKAHRWGKTIRFWNAPDNSDAWQQLVRLGVDWINTDRIKECSAFLRSVQ